MRAFQGQFSDNVAIRRTVQQKELLVRDLEQTLKTCKSKPLHVQITSRVRSLREEIRSDYREEAARAETAVVRATMKQMEVERRPRRQSPVTTANSALNRTT